MPVFLQFRLWLREAPRREHVLAGTSAAIMLIVAMTALAPVPSDGAGAGDDALTVAEGAPLTDGGAVAPAGETAPAAGDGAAPDAAAAPGAAPGAAGAPAAPAAPVTSGGGGSGPGTAGAPAAPGSTGGSGTAPKGPGTTTGSACTGKAASGPGVTATTVTVAMSNLSLGGPIGNQTFDIRPDLEEIANALTDDINDRGGVACGRKLVIRNYDVNTLDSNDQQAKCLQMVALKPIAAFDFGGYVKPSSRQCFSNNKLPLQTATQLGATEVRTGFPYLWSAGALSEQLARNGILGLNARGFFKAPGFKKLGILEDPCDPAVTRELDKALATAGIGKDKQSRFVLDCAVAAPANQIQQAVLKHQSDGATHVFMFTSITNAQNYVRIAAGQNYSPSFGLSDYGSSITSPGAGNWNGIFDGALGITTGHTGAINSGLRSAEVKRCDKALTDRGVPGIRNERQDTAALAYCDLFALFERAIGKAGVNPTRTSLVGGLSTIGTFNSHLLGDGVFNRQGKVTGGDFQRAVTWKADCTCWKIVDRTFARGY